MFYWQPCLRFAGKQLSSGLGNLQGGEQVGDKLGGEEHTHNLGREEHTNNLGGEDYTGLADKLWQDWRRNSCSAPLVSTALCVQRSPSMLCFVAIWSTRHLGDLCRTCFCRNKASLGKKTCLLVERDLPLDISNNMLISRKSVKIKASTNQMHIKSQVVSSAQTNVSKPHVPMWI